MSDPKASGSSVSKEKLDRLVDGEMHEPERMELLTSFEGQPDGWRRCALAFLEAQCWQQELATFADENIPSPAVAPAPIPAKQPRPRAARNVAGRAGTALAMAASFLAAMWLGGALQDRWQSSGVVATNPGDLPNDFAQAETALERVDQFSLPGLPAVARTSDSAPSGSPRGPWQMVTLAPNGPNSRPEQIIELPACEWQEIERYWPNGLPSALPPEVLQSLERMGYRVRRHREMVGVDMEDGRRLMVPVEEVEVHYVGRPSL